MPLVCFYGVLGQWSWELNYFWFALLSLSVSTIRPRLSSLSQLPLTLPHFLHVVLCRPFPSHAMVLSLTSARGRACGISAPIIMLCYCVVCFFYQIQILVSFQTVHVHLSPASNLWQASLIPLVFIYLFTTSNFSAFTSLLLLLIIVHSNFSLRVWSSRSNGFSQSQNPYVTLLYISLESEPHALRFCLDLIKVSSLRWESQCHPNQTRPTSSLIIFTKCIISHMNYFLIVWSCPTSFSSIFILSQLSQVYVFYYVCWLLVWFNVRRKKDGYFHVFLLQI